MYNLLDKKIESVVILYIYTQHVYRISDLTIGVPQRGRNMCATCVQRGHNVGTTWAQRGRNVDANR